jgi:hypothetical protein
MRKTMHKWFFIWDFDKEERWLNEMAANGLALIDVGYCRYTFEPCEPGEYTLRLELLDNVPIHLESERYIRFIESTGAECIGSLFRWVYFRKKKSAGEFDLYSDYAFRIKHLNRILWLTGGVIPVMVMSAVNFLFNFYERWPDVFHLSIGLFFAAFAALGIYGFCRICWMKQKLKREHRLYE